MEFYFDANATTPMSGAAIEVWGVTAREFWHNPSGLYPQGAEAKRFLEAQREELAQLLDCDPGRVIFTSGATEANNAILGYAAHRLKDSNSLMAVSAIEHPCVADVAERVFEEGQLLPLGVTAAGVLDMPFFRSVLRTNPPGFVSVMAANNETGVLQPWREIAMLCRECGIPFHCDAAQWIGKLPLEGFKDCDFVTASAHKFGGPKGVGFCLIPPDSNFRGQIGGPQERGFRGGTENLAAIAAMVAALKDVRPLASGENRDVFEESLGECLEGVRFLGAGVPRLGNTSMFVLPEHKNLRWLTRLGTRGVSVSTGSACSASKGDPSRVMRAMGCGFDEMGRVLRVSALPDASGDDWEALLDALLEVRDELRSGKRASGRGILKICLENL